MKKIEKYRELINNAIALFIYGICDIILTYAPHQLRFLPFVIGLGAAYIFLVNISTYFISKADFAKDKPEVIGSISIGVGILTGIAVLGEYLIGSGIL